jgi:hypothetical protein
MIKSFAISAALAVFIASPAFAMDAPVYCTTAEKDAVMKMVHDTKDQHMMMMAMHDVEMAQSMAAAGDYKSCRDDLMKAMHETMGK